MTNAEFLEIMTCADPEPVAMRKIAETGTPDASRAGARARTHPHLKATDEQVAAAYAEHGSCKKAAVSLGMAHQSVHERLTKLGLIKPQNTFTPIEDELLRAVYDRHANGGTLSVLASLMGRSKTTICRRARALGITSPTRTKAYLSEQISNSAKKRIAESGHPKGMAGKKHSAETKAAISVSSSARWDAMSPEERSAYVLKQLKSKRSKHGPSTSSRGTWKAGWREIGGRKIYARSRWEANYARYLEWLRVAGDIKSWEHEPETFWFEKIKRGVRSYLPDFRVTEKDGRVVYHEVKGWMDARSKTCLNRMRIYHPSVKLLVIQEKEYKAIARRMKGLVNWE